MSVNEIEKHRLKSKKQAETFILDNVQMAEFNIFPEQQLADTK